MTGGLSFRLGCLGLGFGAARLCTPTFMVKTLVGGGKPRGLNPRGDGSNWGEPSDGWGGGGGALGKLEARGDLSSPALPTPHTALAAGW